MTYKTIVVHLTDTVRAPRLLDAAVPLARAADAHLIGLAVIPPYILMPAADAFGAAATIEEHREAYKPQVAQMHDLFTEATRSLAKPSEWRVIDAGFGTIAQAVTSAARCSDLAIVAQMQAGAAATDNDNPPERTVLDAGRPMLIVPTAGGNTVPPKRVTLAWNGRREAARAAFDAVPLLKMADEVNVLTLNPETTTPGAGDLASAEICATLARHGVKCTASQGSAVGIDAGEEILRLAAAFGSDLLVMGCYGHSRMREFILGGASRGVLSNMQLPVLMSH